MIIRRSKEPDKPFLSKKKKVKTSKFDIGYLQNIDQIKKEVRNETYNIILTECHNKIKIYGNNNKPGCFYSIPELLFGKPKYDMNHCISWIIKHLRRDGLTVIQMSNNIIYVFWG